MRKMQLWGVAAACAMMGAACGDQSSTASGPATSGTQGGLLDEAALVPAARIEGRVAQVNIVSDDQSKVPAKMADPHLLNAWGLAFPPNGPAWISANGQGTLEVYDGAGNRAREVAIPPPVPMGDPATPTGQVFNADSSAFGGDKFIAASEDGAVIGWQPSDDGTAVVHQSNAPAVYKGLAIGTAHGKTFLYVADFHDGAIAVFDSDYAPAHLPGSFTDPRLPANYGPFNVITAGPFVLVSYAQQDSDAHDDVAGPGLGLIDVFTTEGFFVQRLISPGGALNSPWAMVFAPDHDRGSVDLMVGNFGDGMINVYDLSVRHGRIDADLEGPLGDRAGKPLVIPGLWALAFGSGGNGFDADKLYFTAGPNGEADGLFGSLRFVGPRR